MSAYLSVGTKRAEILQLLQVNEQGLFAQQIMDKTGFKDKATINALYSLERNELVRKTETGEGHVKYFAKKTFEPEKPYRSFIPFYIDTVQGWQRITMLKRLRDRLIDDHHHTLNLVISDYEVAMRAFENGEDAKDKQG